MRKSDIERLAHRRQPVPSRENAQKQPQGHEQQRAVNLTPETIDAIVGAFSREFRRALLECGPIIARIAAADTIHTTERPASVFGRALLEAQTATGILTAAGVAK